MRPLYLIFAYLPIAEREIISALHAKQWSEKGCPISFSPTNFMKYSNFVDMLTDVHFIYLNDPMDVCSFTLVLWISVVFENCVSLHSNSTNKPKRTIIGNNMHLRQDLEKR